MESLALFLIGAGVLLFLLVLFATVRGKALRRSTLSTEDTTVLGAMMGNFLLFVISIIIIVGGIMVYRK